MRRQLLLLPPLLVLLGCMATGAHAAVVQRDGIRVGVQGSLAPQRLPRQGASPIHVKVSATIGGAEGSAPPSLRRISLAINRNGRLDRRGLPVCNVSDIQPTTNADALTACGESLVGEGTFSAQVGFTGQAPFPASGKLLAFNGTFHGHPAVLAHVYGTDPAPTSYTLPFILGRGQGIFGTTLDATLPDATGTSGYVTGLSISLGRNFTYRGATHSYLSAGCPAPRELAGAQFPLVRARFSFPGGARLVSIVNSSCRAAG